MSAVIFNGQQFAAAREAQLKARVAALLKRPKIVSFFFTEDAAGQLYTRLKKEAAERVGIIYEPHEFSLQDNASVLVTAISDLYADPMVTGVMIQKPSRATWQQALGKSDDPTGFQQWWHTLVEAIPQEKDVDCLHPTSQAAVADGSWREKKVVLPATAQAVRLILTEAQVRPPQSVLILGKSDLLGKPLAAVLQQEGFAVQLWGRGELMQFRQSHPQEKLPAEVIVSATGQPNLITGEMIQPNAIVIDVGEPKGDVEASSVATTAQFLTPVPGGVGPITVVCLLENVVKIV